ncbi:MAG: DUF4124 domain-containing protein [Lysobacterales bacterium]|jgi:hypothetical protein
MVPRTIQVLLLAAICLPLLADADTYRWRDKDGKLHYGESVPAEYADRPYDIINKAGIVIEHVEPGEELKQKAEEKKKEKKRKPLISAEERQRQADRYLLLQYQTEDDIDKEMKLELSQMDYDVKITQQSLESTRTAIEGQIRTLADQQRAGQPVSEKQQQKIDKLYRRLASDRFKMARLDERADEVRARFKQDRERFRYLTSDKKSPAEQD